MPGSAKKGAYHNRRNIPPTLACARPRKFLPLPEEVAAVSRLYEGAREGLQVNARLPLPSQHAHETLSLRQKALAFPLVNLHVFEKEDLFFFHVLFHSTRGDNADRKRMPRQEDVLRQGLHF